MRRLRIISLYTICWAFSAGMFFRHTLLSGGDALPGDRGDTRSLIVILEHWFRVITEGEPWLSPNFFSPSRRCSRVQRRFASLCPALHHFSIDRGGQVFGLPTHFIGSALNRFRRNRGATAAMHRLAFRSVCLRRSAVSL